VVRQGADKGYVSRRKALAVRSGLTELPCAGQAAPGVIVVGTGGQA
jgi:hypothetical protein